MAKALLGHMSGVDTRSSREAQLRRRIADLEAALTRLARDNDALSAALRERDLLLDAADLAPATPERLLEPALH